MKQRRGRTTGDVIAKEGEAVQEDREDEGNRKGAVTDRMLG